MTKSQDEQGLLVYRAASKRYRSVAAIDGVTLSVGAGETWALFGPNGSGKSTMIRLALGQTRLSSGEVSVFGGGFDRLVNPGRWIGAQSDTMGFETGMTARTHLRIIAKACGVPSSHVDDALSAVQLLRTGRLPFGRFSTGMKQRLGFAAAIVAKPPLLILDEPFNGLDVDAIDRHIDYIERHRSDGGAALIATHHVAEVSRVATHVAVVGNRMIWQGTMDDFTRSRTVDAISAYRHVLREGAPA